MTSRPTRRRGALLAIASGWALAAGAPLVLAAPATQEASGAQAVTALVAAEDALAPEPGADPDREATIALVELAEALPALEGPERQRARALLARPTGGSAGGYDVPATDLRRTESPGGRFCIVWAASGRDRPPGADGPGVPAYVDEIAEIAEHSYEVQVGELGWRAPVRDKREECGEPGQSDIYLMDLGRSGVFGYMAPDPGQGGKRRQHGYLVIDNDYRPAQFPGFADPLDAASVTVAHELSHLLQIATSAHQDAWMFEATATWAEEKVYPEIDDYLRYVSHFARNPGVPITAFHGAGGLKVYGSAVLNHWLEHGERRYGPDVVGRAWESSELTKPRDFAVHAYGRAIAGAGGKGFPDEFVRFAAATAEWRTGIGSLPDAERYPDVRRQGRLRPGARGRAAFRVHHTGYRLLRVAPRRARRIRLVVTAPSGLRSGVALVARRGGPVRGRVVRRVRVLRRGGSASVALARPGRFKRITAVAVNADARIDGRRFGDWNYLKDHQPFRARLRVIR